MTTKYNQYSCEPQDDRLAGCIGIESTLPQRPSDSVLEAAPDLLAACKLAVELVKTARRYFPKSMKDTDTFSLENTNATLCTAIRAAEGK